MTSHAACYDLHGLKLAIECEDESLLRSAEAVLGHFASPPSPAPADRIVARRGEVPPAPDGLRLYWRGALADGLPLEYHTSAERRRLHILERTVADVDLSAGAAELTVLPGGDACFVHACLVPALAELLAQAGHHLVHAASLEIPAGAGGGAILLSGVSGRGKTTATLALARAGFRFFADDMTFVAAGEEPGPPALSVWGLRLPCKVHADTIRLLPWLGELRLQPASLPGFFLADTRALWPAERRCAPARAVIFLDERNDRRHLIEAVDKLPAVERLTRENVRATDPSRTGPSAGAFRTFVRLTERCRTFRISAGPDLAKLADEMLACLARDGRP